MLLQVVRVHIGGCLFLLEFVEMKVNWVLVAGVGDSNEWQRRTMYTLVRVRRWAVGI